MPLRKQSTFHLHLVSDATGETLIAVSRAATVQYANVAPTEHVHPLVRNAAQLKRVLEEISAAPGIVLYTLVDKELPEQLEAHCRTIPCPCLSVLRPVHELFQNYLGAPGSAKIGAQHTLSPEYFRRIDALNYTMLHDDGQNTDNLEEADVVLMGISRTSKTPTSIYLANRGIKTANVPLVPGMPLPPHLDKLTRPLVVGLFASPERIVQIRQNRVLALNAARDDDLYVDKLAVAQEIAQSKRLFEQHGWPVIDVSRRSIEETAASILNFLRDHRKTRTVSP